LQLAKVFRAAFGDLLPTLPSKLDGGGIFIFCQDLEGVTSTPADIMHEQQHATNLPEINRLRPQLKKAPDCIRPMTTVMICLQRPEFVSAALDLRCVEVSE
jgi:hypothetical protein